MNTTTSSSCSTWLLALAGLTLFLSTAQAATIGYWRFESDNWLADSSGNDRTLSTASTSSPTLADQTPVYTAIPGAGDGSDFPSVVPQNGLSNTGMAYTQPNTALRPGYFYTDSTGVELDSFTYESYFTKTGNATHMYLGSQWGAGSDRAWSIRITGASIIVALSEDGTTTDYTQDTGFDVTNNTDYYIAVSFDGSNKTDGLSIYLQDLTNETAMQTASFDHTIDSLNYSGIDIHVGGYNTDIARAFYGNLDEVKLSDTVLSQSELLIAIPEASTLSLFAFAGLALVFGLRGRGRIR